MRATQVQSRDVLECCVGSDAVHGAVVGSDAVHGAVVGCVGSHSVQGAIGERDKK